MSRLAQPSGPPIVTGGASTSGYQGGSLARKITSHDIGPIESLVAQRGRDEPLQEEDREGADLRHRRTDTQETQVEGSEKSKKESDPEAQTPPEDKIVFNEDGAGQAPEWTFPDGGWKAWSVVLVSLSQIPSILTLVRLKANPTVTYRS